MATNVELGFDATGANAFDYTWERRMRISQERPVVESFLQRSPDGTRCRVEILNSTHTEHPMVRLFVTGRREAGEVYVDLAWQRGWVYYIEVEPPAGHIVCEHGRPLHHGDGIANLADITIRSEDDPDLPWDAETHDLRGRLGQYE